MDKQDLWLLAKVTGVTILMCGIGYIIYKNPTVTIATIECRRY